MSQDQGHSTIFLIEEDDATRHVLKQALRDYGYRLILALDEEDAMERLSGGQVSADLFLVNLVGLQPEEVLQIGKRVRQQAELDVPLVVIAEKYGKDVEGTDVNVSGKDWITYLEDPDQLRNLLVTLTS